MELEQILKKLDSLADQKNREGMKRFGITGKKILGVSVTDLRKLAKKIPKDSVLAQKLWKTGIHEARILSSIVDEVEKLSEKRMDRMIKDFDSWDIVDQTCLNLFCYHPRAYKKAREWTKKKKEYEKRVGFALTACLAWKDKGSDSKLYGFFSDLKKNATDERKMVKKAVNWALRQIGKRNERSRRKALKIAREIATIDSKAARFIANDAIRELTSEAIIKRLKI